MDDTEAFLSKVVPALKEGVAALHDGDLAPWMALWSRKEPVTLFGAALTARGWADIEPAFRWLATNFSGSHSLEYEAVAGGASGDLGYVVAIERSAATVGGQAATYALRVTTVLRREDGLWKVVHRHGDRYDDSTGAIASIVERAARARV
jgi:ketosteroid isomerase-like protein